MKSLRTGFFRRLFLLLLLTVVKHSVNNVREALVWPNRTDETQSKALAQAHFGLHSLSLSYSLWDFLFIILFECILWSYYSTSNTLLLRVKTNKTQVDPHGISRNSESKVDCDDFTFFIWLFAILASRGLSSITCLRFCCSFVRSNVLFSQIKQHSLRVQRKS